MSLLGLGLLRWGAQSLRFSLFSEGQLMLCSLLTPARHTEPVVHAIQEQCTRMIQRLAIAKSILSLRSFFGMPR